MRGASLAYADLTGATLKNVSFHNQFTNICEPDENGDTNGCSSAYGATLTGATFVEAYIPGLDLTNAVLSGVDFSGAFAMDTNFTGSTVDSDVLGQTVKFNGTVLLGADFENSLFQSVDYTGAYLTDPNRPSDANSATAVVYLSVAYTGFKDSQYVGQGVCTEHHINTPSEPEGSSSQTCVNGSPGPCYQWTLSDGEYNDFSNKIRVTYGPADVIMPDACQGIINYFW